jgi:hypothetical protein
MTLTFSNKLAIKLQQIARSFIMTMWETLKDAVGVAILFAMLVIVLSLGN